MSNQFSWDSPQVRELIDAYIYGSLTSKGVHDQKFVKPDIKSYRSLAQTLSEKYPHAIGINYQNVCNYVNLRKKELFPQILHIFKNVDTTVKSDEASSQMRLSNNPKPDRFLKSDNDLIRQSINSEQLQNKITIPPSITAETSMLALIKALTSGFSPSVQRTSKLPEQIPVQPPLVNSFLTPVFKKVPIKSTQEPASAPVVSTNPTPSPQLEFSTNTPKLPPKPRRTQASHPSKSNFSKLKQSNEILDICNNDNVQLELIKTLQHARLFMDAQMELAAWKTAYYKNQMGVKPDFVRNKENFNTQ